MNKIFITDVENNFQDVRVQDIGLIQNTSQELTSTIAKILADGRTYMILTGCVLTDNISSYNLTEGYIWYLDEIYKVDAVVNMPYPGGVTIDTIKSTWRYDLLVPASGLVRQFKNGIGYDPYLYRKATLVQTPTTWTVDSLIPNNMYTYKSGEKTTIQNMIDGIDADKYVTPYLLARQGDNLFITYPAAYTTAAFQYAATIYKNGYHNTVDFSGSFSLTTDRNYVELTLDKTMKQYGFTTGTLLPVSAKISRAGYHTIYTNLICEIANAEATILRLYKPQLDYVLKPTSGVSELNQFYTNETYEFTINYTK